MNKEKVYLFNGKDLENWVTRDTGETPDWTIEDGVMTVGHGSIISKQEFGDAHLHVEFRTPYLPDVFGQDRGNSGVYVQGCYEIQVLDSYNIEPALDNDCSGLYEMYAPLCNACKPPMEWQPYDIILRAARFNEYGEISENGRMTVIHNGIVVHNNVELPHVTPGGITNNKRVARGPLMLQDHRSAVSYRNIWVMNLDHYN